MNQIRHELNLQALEERDNWLSTLDKYGDEVDPYFSTEDELNETTLKYTNWRKGFVARKQEALDSLR